MKATTMLAAAAIATAAATVFQQQGPLHLSAGTYLIKFRVDLSGFHDHCRAFRNNTDRALQLVSDGAAKFAFNQTVAAMMDACERAEYWPSRWPVRRQKRQVGLMLLGAAFGGLVTSLWESATDHSHHIEGQLRQMRRELEDLTRTTAQIAEALHKSLHLQAQLASIEGFAAATARNIHSLDAISEALEVLVTADRVSPKLVPPVKAASMWHSVARELRRQSLPQSPLPSTALYELPTTYKFAPDFLEIGVHFPVIKETFTLYHTQQHPIWLPEHPHPLLVGPAGYLAVAPDMRSFVRPNQDLASCMKIKSEPVCPLVIDRTDWQGDCLAALFKGFIVEALKICRVEPFLGQWAAEQINRNDFDLVVTEATPFTVVCRGKEVQEGQWPAGNHTVTVEPSCQIISVSFTLYPVRQWYETMVVAPAWRWVSAKAAMKALKEGIDKAAKMEEVTQQLMQEADDLDAETTAFSGLHIGGASIIVATVGGLLGAAAMAAVIKYRAAKKTGSASEAVDES
jgi:hypothetical protein